MERRSPNRRVGGRTERAESEFGAPIEPSSRRTKEADETGWAWGKSATCCRRPAGRTDFAFKDGSSGRMPEARSDEVERAESEFGAPIVPSPNTLKRGHRTKRGCGTGVMECRGIESAKHHYSNTPFLPKPSPVHGACSNSLTTSFGCERSTVWSPSIIIVVQPRALARS